MKTKFKDLKSKTTNAINDVRYQIAMGVGASMLGFPCISNAAINDNTGASNIIQSIVEIFVNLIPWIGVVFLVIAAIQIGLAFRNDNNPDQMANGIKSAIVGGVFIVFKLVIYDGIIKKYI